MKKKDALAADYWIENTARIYSENLHVSSPVMDAYRAGFEEARIRAAGIIRDIKDSDFNSIMEIGEEECE